MKLKRIVRVLCLFGFLLLVAPFYKQCEGGSFMKDTAKTEEPAATEVPVIGQDVALDSVGVSIDSIDVKSDSVCVAEEVQSEQIEEKSFFRKAYEFIDDDSNENAFELAIMCRGLFEKSLTENITEFRHESPKNKFEDIVLLTRSFTFVFIIIFTTLIFILSFFNKMKLVHKLSKWNLILLLIAIICILFFDPLFETYKQIKWGYYAFTITQILILFISKNLLKESESN